MEKLTIEHLAPYLPYVLKLKSYESKRNPYILLGIQKSNYNDFFWVTLQTTTKLINKFNDGSNNYKPILRPLSDLIKEVDVVNGGVKFIPMIELSKVNNSWIKKDKEEGNLYCKYSECGVYTSFLKTASPDDYGILYIEVYDLLMQPYSIMSKLFKWHFDVFGLIEKGLAIDINTLK